MVRTRKNTRSIMATMLVSIPVSTVNVINFWTSELATPNGIVLLFA